MKQNLKFIIRKELVLAGFQAHQAQVDYVYNDMASDEANGIAPPGGFTQIQVPYFANKWAYRFRREEEDAAVRAEEES